MTKAMLPAPSPHLVASPSPTSLSPTEETSAVLSLAGSVRVEVPVASGGGALGHCVSSQG